MDTSCAVTQETMIQERLKLIDFYRTAKNYEQAGDIAVGILQEEFKEQMPKISTERRGELRQKAEQEINKLVKDHRAQWKNPSDGSSPMTDEQIEQWRSSMIEESYQNALKKEIAEKFDASGLSGAKLEAWERYRDIFDPKGEWFEMADQTWDTIVKEVAINAPLVMISGGTASLVRAGVSKGACMLATRVVGREAIAATTRYLGSRALLRGGLRLTGSSAGLLVEAATFKSVMLGFNGQTLADLPDPCKQILKTAIMLGAFKQGERLGNAIVNTKAIGPALAKIKNPAMRGVAEFLAAKGHTEALALFVSEGINQGLIEGDLKGLMDNFGNEVLKNYIEGGSLEFGQGKAGALLSRYSEIARQRKVVPLRPDKASIEPRPAETVATSKPKAKAQKKIDKPETEAQVAQEASLDLSKRNKTPSQEVLLDASRATVNSILDDALGAVDLVTQGKDLPLSIGQWGNLMQNEKFQEWASKISPQQYKEVVNMLHQGTLNVNTLGDAIIQTGNSQAFNNALLIDCIESGEKLQFEGRIAKNPGELDFEDIRGMEVSFVDGTTYQLTDKLGPGIDGVVFEARAIIEHSDGTISYGEKVAIKIGHPEVRGSVQHTMTNAAHNAEAWTLTELKGDSATPEILDTHRVQHGNKEGRAIVMEKIEGQTLDEFISAAFKEDGNTTAVIKVCSGLSDNLVRSYEKGIMHNDFHRNNTMIREGSGEPVAIDWASARVDESVFKNADKARPENPYVAERNPAEVRQYHLVRMGENFSDLVKAYKTQQGPSLPAELQVLENLSEHMLNGKVSMEKVGSFMRQIEQAMQKAPAERNAHLKALVRQSARIAPTREVAHSK